MIFFNVPAARHELLSKGLVYTLRSSFRAVGRTEAVTGSYYNWMYLCDVEVTKVIAVVQPDDLAPYLRQSGFSTVDIWLSKAAPSARALYLVIRQDE